MSRSALTAGACAAVLSGAPSTLHALATGRDPLEATKAAGSIVLPGEHRALPLVVAATPVHLALSFGWASSSSGSASAARLAAPSPVS